MWRLNARTVCKIVHSGTIPRFSLGPYARSRISAPPTGGASTFFSRTRRDLHPSRVVGARCDAGRHTRGLFPGRPGRPAKSRTGRPDHMLSTNYVPGVPNWVDLATTDVDAAAAAPGGQRKSRRGRW